MKLVNGHESFLALSNRGAPSVLDASFKFARAFCLVSGKPWSTVRMEQSAFDGGILCLLRSDWSLRWLDVCICTDASEKGFAFAVRERCRELASKIERLSERTRFRSTSRSFQFGRGCDVACSKVSHSSCAPVTFVGYLWGWLDRSPWMNHRCSGPQLILVQKPVRHEFPGL